MNDDLNTMANLLSKYRIQLVILQDLVTAIYSLMPNKPEIVAKFKTIEAESERDIHCDTPAAENLLRVFSEAFQERLRVLQIHSYDSRTKH